MMVAPEHAALSEHLNAYLDGELPAAAHEGVARHVDACAACQLELEQLRATRLALQALVPLRAPRPFTVEAPAPAARLGSWLDAVLPWVWRLSGVATAACLLLAALTSQSRPTSGTITALAPAERQVAPAAKSQDQAAISGAAAGQAAQAPSAPTAAAPTAAARAAQAPRDAQESLSAAQSPPQADLSGPQGRPQGSARVVPTAAVTGPGAPASDRAPGQSRPSPVQAAATQAATTQSGTAPMYRSFGFWLVSAAVSAAVAGAAFVASRR